MSSLRTFQNTDRGGGVNPIPYFFLSFLFKFNIFKLYLED